MNPMAVVGIALGIGLIVYALSLRNEDEELLVQPVRASRRRRHGGEEREDHARAVGFQPEGPATTAETFSYVPVTTEPDTIRTRLMGLGGLILLVVFSAGVLALSIYQAGHMVNQTLARFLGK